MLAIMLLAARLLAQTQAAAPAPAPPPRPCAAAEFRQFDFWLGQWDVFNPAGQKIGTNSITSIDGGCVLLESWTSARGGTGHSFNFYEPATKRWRPPQSRHYLGILELRRFSTCRRKSRAFERKKAGVSAGLFGCCDEMSRQCACVAASVSALPMRMP